MNLEPLYIITGTTGGIGSEIAECLATEGKSLLLACRNLAKAEEQCLYLKRLTGNTDIQCVRLDLDSFDGVCSFVEQIKALNRPVASLINNAGIMSRFSTITSDGYEQDFQVNVFSTALLSFLLEPLVCDGGSIVFTTSVTRNIWKLSKDFPIENHFGQLATYGRSKRAITMFAVWFAERLFKRNVHVNCADPGVVNSGMITMQRWFDPLANVFFRPFISSTTDGALSVINAMKSHKTGKIYYHEKEMSPSQNIVKDSSRVVSVILKVLEPYL